MNDFKLNSRGMKLFHWQWLWFWFLLSVLIILLANIYFIHSMEILIAFLTLVGGVFYFLHQQHLEKARFFKELVTEFNRRYDKQNNYLLTVLDDDDDKPLQKEQKDAFIDYFNLCAEEYLFYQIGYIYERVWEAWYNGMKQFGQDPRIVKLWKKESQTYSYYDFEFPINDKNEEQ